MPRSSRWPAIAPEMICVLDTCALVNMKKTELLKIEEQFGIFVAMTPMLASGALAFPRQVAAEMARAQYPDTPGTWVVAYKSQVIYPDPGDDAMAEVQGAAQLTDPAGDSDFEPADPYVVAMAWELSQHYPKSRVNVVSDDFVDRMPRKQSVAFACNELGIECWRSDTFVEHMRGVMTLHRHPTATSPTSMPGEPDL